MMNVGLETGRFTDGVVAHPDSGNVTINQKLAELNQYATYEYAYWKSQVNRGDKQRLLALFNSLIETKEDMIAILKSVGIDKKYIKYYPGRNINWHKTFDNVIQFVGVKAFIDAVTIFLENKYGVSIISDRQNTPA